MKIAIHHRKGSFSDEWIKYCNQHGVNYKIVSCYSTDIIKEIEDCNALMWHFHQSSPKDVLFAKELLYSVQNTGKKVYPDFNTAWHFDDKVGQKYLLEALKLPIVPSYVFYDKSSSLQWIMNAEFPKVFKLRRGASSAHVKLVKNKAAAIKLTKKAFSGRGFSQYEPFPNLIERWRNYRNKNTSLFDVLKGIARLVHKTKFSKVVGNEKGYIYMQDYIPGMDHDIRVTVVGDRAFASKRKVRKYDFRASGSGIVEYGQEQVPLEALTLAFRVAQKLKMQSVAVDIVLSQEKALILELSYGFGAEESDLMHGHWDSGLKWYNEPFNRPEYVIENLISKIKCQ